MKKRFSYTLLYGLLGLFFCAAVWGGPPTQEERRARRDTAVVKEWRRQEATAATARERAQARRRIVEHYRQQEERNYQMGLGGSSLLREELEEGIGRYADQPEECATMRLLRAEWHFYRDERDTAVQQYQAVIQDYPGTEAAAAALLGIADVYDSPFNPQRASARSMGLYRQVADDYPQSQAAATALAHLGVRQWMEGEVNGAQATLEDMIQRYRHSPEVGIQEEVATARYTLALCYARKKQYQRAEQILAQLLREYRGNGRQDYFTESTRVQLAAYQWALALAAQGQRERAIRALEEFRQRYPEGNLFSRAQQWIEKLQAPPPPPPRPRLRLRSHDLDPSGVRTSGNESLTCGPVALWTVCRAFQVDTSVEELTRLAGSDATGTSLQGLGDAARAKGLTAEARECSRDELAALSLPALALLHGGHYVVLVAVDDNEVELINEDQGRQRLPRETFDRMWTGAVLAFHPPDQPPGPRVGRTLTPGEAQMLRGAGSYCGNAGGQAEEPCETGNNAGLRAAGGGGSGGGGCQGGNCASKGGLTVNAFTGNLMVIAEDAAVNCVGLPTVLERTYNFQGTSDPGPFGRGWSSPLTTHLTPLWDGMQYTSPTGRKDSFTEEAGGSYTSPFLVRDELVKNGDDTFTLTHLDGTQEHFSATGLLTGWEDRNGNTTTFSYDANNHLSMITDAADREFPVTTNAAGQITRIGLPGGLEVTYQYDASGRLTTATDPAGDETHYEYTGDFILTALEDHEGRRTTFTYAENSRNLSVIMLTGVTTPDGQTYSYDYGAVLTATDPRGYRTLYDTGFVGFYHGRIFAVTDPLGQKTTSYEFNASGRPSAVVDGNGNKTTRSYDSAGNVTALTDPLGQTTSFTYDSENRLTSVTDPLDNTTTYEYDDNGNLTEVTDPLDHTTTYTYNAQGQKTGMTDPRGNTTTYTYDTYGNLKTVTDPLGNTVTYGYDALDRRTSVRDARGNTTYYTYDGKGRVTQVTYPDNSVETKAYNCCQLTSQTDANGNTTTYTYDPRDRLIKVTDALEGETQYEYDTAGNRTAVIDANGNRTEYEYDGANRLVKVTYPDDATETYTYDPAGNRVTKKDARGYTTYYTYDALGRVVKVEAGATTS